MPFNLSGRTLKQVAVIGSGRVGPDIAFYFSQVLSRYSVPVFVVDVDKAALEQGSARTRQRLDEGVAKRAFKPGQAEAIFNNIAFTPDYDQIKGAELVVEAATEDLAVKREIFERVESLVADDAVIASNSSHIEPEVVFAKAKHKGRTLVAHYFYPADRNMLVEIVPGADTFPTLVDFVMRLYEQLGKLPIRVDSRYGYAIDPISEGLFLAAALCVEEGLCDVKQADAIACKALGLAAGPFTAMNLTAGNLIARRGLAGMHEKIMPWFRPPEILEAQIESGEPWPVAARGEKAAYSNETYGRVSRRLLGAYFGLACEILDARVSYVADLDLAVEVGLAAKPPFTLMNAAGIADSAALVGEYAAANQGFRVPETLAAQAKAGAPWAIPVVLRRDEGDVAIVTIRRPRVLNALNADVIHQLKRTFDAIRADADIKAVVLTGFGIKAFVSGADINELAALRSPEEAIAFAVRGQGVLSGIENLGKPVVAAMNGLAFGGGNELAMACTCRIAAAGLPVLAGQPEPKLGIIPGYGGTQRLPRLIGMERAWPLLRSGAPFSSAQALEWGLILKETPAADLVDDAAKLARAIAAETQSVKPIPKGPISVPDTLPEVDIGHLSTRIDAILMQAALEGAGMGLYQGLVHEANLFGECLTTEDARIGLKNFIENGPKVNAAFKNK